MKLMRFALFLGVFSASVGAGAAGGGTMRAHMDEHFARATLAQTAVINGDLARARLNAGWLLGHDSHKAIPEGADQAMRAAARTVLEATDLASAAAGVGRIGAACGACHLGQGVNPGIDSVVDMEYGVSLPARMARHQWAVDRMWEGLVNPSDEIWVRGAETLMESPLQGGGGTDATGALVDNLGEEVFGLAKKARTTLDKNSRAEIYGELLVRCATCHEALRPRP